jgi:hypothetical protein
MNGVTEQRQLGDSESIPNSSTDDNQRSTFLRCVAVVGASCTVLAPATDDTWWVPGTPRLGHVYVDSVPSVTCCSLMSRPIVVLQVGRELI